MDETMKLVIGWTIVGGFVFTTAATCLSMMGWLKFADPKQQRVLFKALVVEVVVGTGASVAGGIRLDPGPVKEQLRAEGGTDALLGAIADGLGGGPAGAAVAEKAELERLVVRVTPPKGSPEEKEVAELRTAISKLPAGKVAPDAAKILVARPVLTRKATLRAVPR